MRFALGVEYDGSDFSGWESQPGQRTVQSTLESALSSVANSPVDVVCVGRTDAGVHAMAQVVHFDSQVRREPHEWVLGANSNLSDDVSVRWASPVVEDFHARYSARCRYYRYVIQNRRVRPALLRRRAAWERGALDIASMCSAGEHLLGDDGEGTVDSSHPTDLGFVRQADAFEKVLRPILKSNGHAKKSEANP